MVHVLTVRLVPIVALALLVTGCRTTRDAAAPPLLQPGAPGGETQPIAAAAATDLSKVGFTPADVQFMQGMIGHHSQAVEMVGLLATRTESPDMKLLGKRIEVSQEDEVGMMQEWLRARRQPPPDPHAHHKGHMMPGMLSAEEMAQLAEAKGPAFDKLFLQGMIRHHEGALTMVQELFATPGAGQEADIFAFASDVDADQRMEIARMRGMLSVLQ